MRISIVDDATFNRVTGHKPNLKSPHFGNEYRLMIQANKPMACFVDTLPGNIPEGCKVEAFDNRWLVYWPSQVWRARAWHRLYSMKRRGLISTRMAHIRCGILLGYTNKQIFTFLDRGERLR